MPTRSIFVSQFNCTKNKPPIDWYAVKKSGVQMAYIRVMYGIERDDAFLMNRQGATEAGVMWGGMHFFRSSQNPWSQARELADFLGDDLGHLLCCIDLELDCKQDLKGKELVESVEAFFSEAFLQGLGNFAVYTSPGWWNDNMLVWYKPPKWTDNHPLHVAHWMKTGPYAEVNNPTLPKGFSSWALWQYWCKAAVEGIVGDVCVDAIGDLNKLKREPVIPDDEMNRRVTALEEWARAYRG